MTLAYTIYTDDLPEDIGGRANAFIVRIKTKYKDDVGIHNHEYTHVNQFWIASILSCAAIALVVYALNLDYPFDHSFIYPYILAGFATHSLLYKFVRPYRLYAEAQAYAAQAVPFPPAIPSKDQMNLMAWRLALPLYDLNITQRQAYDEILNHR